MSTREDMKRFYGMDLDFGAIGLQKPDRDMVYFCTPEGAEPAGSLGVDGICGPATRAALRKEA